MIKKIIIMLTLVCLSILNVNKICYVWGQEKISDERRLIVKIKDINAEVIDIGVLTVVNTETRQKIRVAFTTLEECKLVNLIANKYVFIVWTPGFEPTVATIDYREENKKELNFILRPAEAEEHFDGMGMPIITGTFKDPTMQSLQDDYFYALDDVGGFKDIDRHITNVLRWSSKNGHIDYVKALASIGANE